MAQKNGIASRAVKSGADFVSLIVSLLPLPMTPEAFLALPLRTASAPTMSAMNCPAGDCMAGFRSRLNAATKLAAVSVLPLLKRIPLRIVNV